VPGFRQQIEILITKGISMCNPKPGTRCVNSGEKSLASSIKKAEENSVRADQLGDAVRIAKNNDDIEFNAERYENVSKSLATSLENVNTRKIYIYASSTPNPELARKLRESTAHFGAYEKTLLKSEDDLMKTGKLLKKFQDSADAARKANDARDEPVDYKEVVKGVDTKTFPKLHADIKKKIDANYASKIKLSKSPEEKKALQTEHANHLSLLDNARSIAENDARSVYAPKQATAED
jgi:hypothetical protein